MKSGWITRFLGLDRPSQARRTSPTGAARNEPLDRSEAPGRGVGFPSRLVPSPGAGRVDIPRSRPGRLGTDRVAIVLPPGLATAPAPRFDVRLTRPDWADEGEWLDALDRALAEAGDPRHVVREILGRRAGRRSF